MNSSESFSAKDSAVDLEQQEEEHEFREVLKKLDFALIKKTIQELAVKSGVDSDKTTFIEADNVKNERMGLIAGCYNAVHRDLKINFRLEKGLHRTPDTIETGILATLIHEELHAGSATVCTSNSKGEMGTKKLRYLEAEPVPNNEKYAFKYFTSFNEGVTETLARQLFSSYIKTRYSQEQVKEAERVVTHKFAGAYNDEVMLVKLIVDRLGEVSGFSPETVWSSIVRGYFEGQSLNDPELKEIIEAVMPNNFLRNLKSAQDPKDTRKINKVLHPRSLPMIKKKLLIWIEKQLARDNR